MILVVAGILGDLSVSDYSARFVWHFKILEWRLKVLVENEALVGIWMLADWLTW